MIAKYSKYWNNGQVKHVIKFNADYLISIDHQTMSKSGTLKHKLSQTWDKIKEKGNSSMERFRNDIQEGWERLKMRLVKRSRCKTRTNTKHESKQFQNIFDDITKKNHSKNIYNNLDLPVSVQNQYQGYVLQQQEQCMHQEIRQRDTSAYLASEIVLT